MHALKATALSLLAAAAIFAADPSGKWEAVTQTPRGEMTMTFNFKVEGEKLTGTVGNPMMGQSKIQDGKISGDTITFKQVMSRGDREMTIEWKGVVQEDAIEFTRSFAGMGGGPGGRPQRKDAEGGRNMTITAKRAGN